jgi:hypothetical protein
VYLVSSFRWADCGTNYYLVVAEVRERLSVTKRATRKFRLKKLNEVGDNEPNQAKISNSSAALENLVDDVDINRAWENIRGNIKISAEGSLDYYEEKQH